MAYGSKNRVRVQGEYDDKISGPLAKTRDAFDRLGKNKGAQAVLQGVGIGGGIQAFDLLKRGIEGVVQVTADSLQSASDLRESMTLNEQVFERNSEAVNQWARDAAGAFGESQREALNFASEFGTAFKNVGLSLDDTTQRAEAMTRLAADLGSAFNRSSEEAATALRSGLLGESEPLRAFGVFLDEAKVKAKALAMGMKPVNGAFTDAQKVTARYQLILEQTADSQGMFGRDSESLADTQKTLAAEIENLQAEIGQQLLPVARDLAKWARDEGVPALEGVFRTVRDNKEAIDLLATAFDVLTGGPVNAALHQVEAYQNAQEEATKATQDLWESTDRLGGGFRGVASAASDAAGVAGDLGDVGSDVAKMFDGIRKDAADAAKALDSFTGNLNDAMKAVVDASYGPQELQLKLQATKLELKANEKALHDLEKIKHPTADQQQDMVDLRLRIIDGKRELLDLQGQFLALDGLSLADAKKQLDAVAKAGGASAAQIREAWRAALQLNSVTKGTSGLNPRTASVARAAGGPVMPGGTYTVGEDGQETLVMSPAGGGYVFPNGGGSGGGSSTVVHTHIYLDGREIADVVDRHLYYKAARAPQSSFAG